MGFLTDKTSSGTLEQDIIDIGINQMGKKEYNDLKPEAKKLLDEYASDMVKAFKAFLERQTFNITHMDAPVVIQPINPWMPGPSQTFGLTVMVPMAPPVPFFMTSPLYGRSQISKDVDKIGVPQVGRNVKDSKVQLLKPED